MGVRREETVSAGHHGLGDFSFLRLESMPYLSLGLILYALTSLGHASGKTRGRFEASAADMLAMKTEITDVKYWTQQNPEISSIIMKRQVDNVNYDESFGEMFDADSNLIGETFIIRDKITERVINLNIMMSGESFLFVKDSNAQSNSTVEEAKVHTIRIPKPSIDKEAEAAAQTELFRRSPRKKKTPRADEDFTWGYDIAIPEGEKDADGLYVLDGLFIFSTQALAYLSGNYLLTVDEFVELNLLMVTIAWRNSGIDDAKVRAVSTQIWEPDLAVNVDNAYWVNDNTVDARDAVGADFVTYFTTGTENGPASASGLGGIEEPYILLQVDGIYGWRHELGHNAGMNHCWSEDDGFGYKHGWELETLQGPPGTIMCGNSISLYSSPLLNVHGVVAGDAEKADAARQWRDAMPFFSGQREHIVPFNGEKPTYVLSGTMVQNIITDNIVEWNVVESTSKMIFKTAAVDTWDPENKHAVWLNSDCCPGIYYGQHFESNAHLLSMPCPAAGNWKAYISGPGPTNFTIEMYV